MRLAAVLACACACGTKSGPPAEVPSVLLGSDSPSGARSSVTIPGSLAGMSLYVADVEGLTLFDDEARDAATMVASWAQHAGLTVEDLGRTRQIFARASRGEDAVTGKTCGARLAHSSASERWRSELHARGRIEAGVYCTPQCWLRVDVSEGLELASSDAGRTAFYAAPYDATRPWRSELPTRLAQLIDWHGPGEPDDSIAVPPGSVAATGPLDPAFDVRTPAAAKPTLDRELRAAVTRCASGSEVTVVVELAGQDLCPAGSTADGRCGSIDHASKVTRCEPYDRNGPSGAGADCACKALAGQPIAAGRRAVVFVNDPAPKVTTATGATVSAILTATRAQGADGIYLPVVTDPAIAEWDPSDVHGLAACFADSTATAATIAATVSIEFDRDGAATNVTLTPMAGVMSPTARGCVQAVIKTIKAPCPSAPHASASAELTVTFRS